MKNSVHLYMVHMVYMVHMIQRYTCIDWNYRDGLDDLSMKLTCHDDIIHVSMHQDASGHRYFYTIIADHANGQYHR